MFPFLLLYKEGFLNCGMESPYVLTLKMRFHILMHGFRWHPYEMSQVQCKSVGFLSGDRGEYHCYNNLVSRCGDIIKFPNNCRRDSSVSTKYAFLK